MSGHRVWISRGALLAFGFCMASVLAGLVALLILASQLNDQQAKDAELARANARVNTRLCKIATGLDLYQPNLDPRVAAILAEVVAELPPKCFPSRPRRESR